MLSNWLRESKCALMLACKENFFYSVCSSLGEEGVIVIFQKKENHHFCELKLKVERVCEFSWFCELELYL